MLSLISFTSFSAIAPLWTQCPGAIAILNGGQEIFAFVEVCPSDRLSGIASTALTLAWRDLPRDCAQLGNNALESGELEAESEDRKAGWWQTEGRSTDLGWPSFMGGCRLAVGSTAGDRYHITSDACEYFGFGYSHFFIPNSGLNFAISALIKQPIGGGCRLSPVSA